jgi:hypothetical protein
MRVAEGMRENRARADRPANENIPNMIVRKT